MILDFINPEVVLALERVRLGLSHLWLLEYIKKGEKIDDKIRRSSIFLTLTRKGLVDLESEKLTGPGLQILQIIDSEFKNIVEGKSETMSIQAEPAKDMMETMFEEWWSAFPATDRIKDNNGKVIFSETRVMRQGKEYCKTKYMELLKSYSHEDLMRSLKYEVETKRESSLTTKKNELKFLQNSKSYLLNKSFEPFIDISKEEKVENKSKNTNAGDFHI